MTLRFHVKIKKSFTTVLFEFSLCKEGERRTRGFRNTPFLHFLHRSSYKNFSSYTFQEAEMSEVLVLQAWPSHIPTVSMDRYTDA